jgi:hypothetical protein
MFEVVIAKGDLKLRHLACDPRCILVIFEAARPFRGVEVCGVSELVECDVRPVRAAIARRYLGADAGARYVAARSSSQGFCFGSPATVRASGIWRPSCRHERTQATVVTIA